MPKGTERLRITPSPYHDNSLIDMLAAAMVEVWQELDMPLCRALVAEWSLRQQALFDRQFKLPHSQPSQESWRRRILRIVSLPDFVEHSLTHREEIGDNGNAGPTDHKNMGGCPTQPARA